jgi:formamidopyrimidine-DNA glycosylase
VPEGVEIELYRRSAEGAVGRAIARVDVPDAWFLKDGATPESVREAAFGRTLTGARRRGKLLVLDLDGGRNVGGGVRLGLRFGMTGRLVVDGQAAIPHLEYSSRRNDPGWVRFGLGFADGGDLFVNDPRRLGGVSVDPDEDAMGADAFSIDTATWNGRVLVGDVSIKARLLDQKRIAGVGNLIADETLWRAGVDPARAAGSLPGAEGDRLLGTLREVLDDFMADGGSHTGRLHDSRRRGGCCPVDGSPLLRRQIGGRTTYSCAQHQH